jgi:prepilin-type processing-associated H-X9-DG protein
VIAIIGILIALLLPAIQAARESARRTQCTNNLKQIGIAVQSHHDTRKHFPTGRNKLDQYAVSWAFFLLPYLEETALYNSYDAKARADDPPNKATMCTPIETFACPSRRKAAADRNFDNNESPPLPHAMGVASLTDYAAAAGLQTRTGVVGSDVTATKIGEYDRKDAGPIFTASRIGARQVSDGLSKTMAVAERHMPPVPANISPEMEHHAIGDTAAIAGDTPNTIFRGTETGLAQGPDDPSAEKFGSSHSGGLVQAVFLDGHVGGLRPDIAIAVIQAMSTIGGAEVVPDEG